MNESRSKNGRLINIIENDNMTDYIIIEAINDSIKKFTDMKTKVKKGILDGDIEKINNIIEGLKNHKHTLLKQEK